ncbi:HD domain-containing protein [Kribbella sp. NPDC056345]|uniref:HD domain-containing protein n=1 Tax=Kribbella sp. NPDC056345 TaxID=3345789 RepID=UPI0035E189F5
MAAVGSPAWVARSNGSLSPLDQVRFAVTAAAREVAVLAARLRAPSARVLDVDRLPPDTPLATKMARSAAAVLPGPLLQHSIRTWLWGSMLAELDGIKYDEELLYVAAMLHDIGLSDAHRGGGDVACFAVHGATEARSLALAAGADQVFAREVFEAIAAHFNMSVPLSWGAESHLLNAGAYFDVVGRRLGEIAPATVIDVLRRAPRTGFDDCIIAAMREERRLHPRSRAALLHRLGMERSIRRAGFPLMDGRG